MTDSNPAPELLVELAELSLLALVHLRWSGYFRRNGLSEPALLSEAIELLKAVLAVDWNGQERPRVAPTSGMPDGGGRDAVMTAREVATMLQISERSVRRMAADGRLSPVRPTPRSVRYRRADVLAFIDGRP